MTSRQLVRAAREARADIGGLGWPTPGQRLLLQVVVAEAELARAAWVEWRGGVQLAQLDVGSLRLLPLVARRFEELGVEELELGRLRGVARHTWASNQQRMRSGLKAAEALIAAGIRVCALKGMALLWCYYDADLAVRPMYDVDLLVQPERVTDARGVLEAMGFRSRELRDRSETSRYVRSNSGCAFVRGYDNIDLHWHVLHQDPSRFFDTVAWETATPLLESGVDGLLGLAPTELLIHLCLHGVRHDASSNRIWPLDAIRVLSRSADRIDWSRLGGHASRRALSVALADSLDLLVSLGASVPPETLAALHDEPILFDEVLEYQATTGHWPRLSTNVRTAAGRMTDLRRRFETMAPALLRGLD
jgi:hypothetical protein